jgi:hypothetical protein
MWRDHHPERKKSQWSAAERIGIALIVIALFALWMTGFY